ncbi:hypothetical protein ACIBF1_08625 [Spirillospora sp. NPDC050679]
MVTFGDMIQVADASLARVERTLDQPGIDAEARHPATVNELARFTRTLIRYTDQVATGFGTPYDHNADTRDAARRAGALLQQAQDLLGTPAWTEHDGPPLAKRLHGTSLALGCGLDLLDTHITEAPDLSPNAAVIATTDTARSLLHILSRHAAAAGHVALRSGPQARSAGDPLLKAALLTSVFGQRDTSGITAIPLRHIPERLPPAVGEERSQALTGIGVSLQRLNADTGPASVTTWRYLAQAAAITFDINYRLIHQLGQRAGEVGDERTATALRAVEGPVRHVGEKWKTIVRKLTRFADRQGPSASGPVPDAGDLVLRLGRLAFTDPAWLPHRGSATRLTPPEQLAPSPPDIGTMALTVLKVTDTCHEIARRHHAAVSRIAGIGARDGDHHPLPEAQELTRWYAGLQTACERVLTELSDAVQHIGPKPPEEAADLALIRQRITAPRALPMPTAQPNPAAMAQAGFPAPITEAIPPALIAERPRARPAPPSPSPPRGRSTK